MIKPMYIPDRPAESDAFGRTQFSKYLATVLLSVNKDDGMVVGIEGGWGSGKSTIIGLVKKEFLASNEGGKKAIIVDFNPWMLSNTGALVEALVTQIAAAISLNLETPEKAFKVGEKLLGYVGLIKHLKYLKYVPGVTFAGNIAEGIYEVSEKVEEHNKDAQDALADIKKLLPALDLAKKKSEVVEALRELARPIVVIVDDVDRLPAEEIRIVVQAIKAVADFPGTTYLLAYDRYVVAEALGNGSVDSGLSYLEKIVQLAYPIPPLFEYQLRNFVEKQLQGLLSSLNLELYSFETPVYTKAVGLLTRLARHPRDVIRLMNRLMLSLSATRNEVNAIDVMVFEAVSQRFPQIRESVHSHPSDFTGHEFRGDSSFDDEFDWTALAELENEREKGQSPWKKYMPEHEPDRTIAMKACAFLFPKRGGKHRGVPENELHIADPDRLARYFRMASLEGVPEVKDIHSMLSQPKMLAESLAGGECEELIFLLEWTYNYLPSCLAPDVKGCTEVIVDRAILAEKNCEFTQAQAELFAKVMTGLVRKADTGMKSESFLLIINKSPLSISEEILLEAAVEQGKWYMQTALSKTPDLQFVPDSDVVDEALAIWSSKVRDCVEKGTLSNETRMHSILYRFAQLNFAYTEMYKMVKKICSTEQGLEKFLSMYVKDSIFDSIGEYALIENAQVLVDRINGASSSLQDKYSWFASHITSIERAKAIDEQSTRLKGLNAMSS